MPSVYMLTFLRPSFRTVDDMTILCRFCAGNRLCRQFPRTAWPDLCKRIGYTFVPEGNNVFTQGEAIGGDSCVYVLLEGEVQ